MKRLLTIGFLGAIAALGEARAASCVEIDVKRDNLSPEEQRAAQTLLEEALRAAGREIDDKDCNGIYRVVHARLGNTISVSLTGPEGSRKMQASSLDELPAVYDRLVQSLIKGESVEAAVRRDNVTEKEAEPRRMQADGLSYVRIGPGGVLAPRGLSIGPAFGLGYRGELDRAAVDISMAFHLPGTDEGQGPIAGSFSLLRAVGLFFTEPTASSSPYLGGGASVGGALGGDGGGFGVQGDVTLGMEWMRASSIRLFVEASGVLPFYGFDTNWMPSASVSFGVGYQPRSIFRR